MKYLIVIEETHTGYSAYSPDIDGCISTGATLNEIKHNMQEAIELHLEGLQEEGYQIPVPTSSTAYLEVPV
jgi:predicted RNase H-like HicB family nuclease